MDINAVMPSAKVAIRMVPKAISSLTEIFRFFMILITSLEFVDWVKKMAWGEVKRCVCISLCHKIELAFLSMLVC